MKQVVMSLALAAFVFSCKKTETINPSSNPSTVQSVEILTSEYNEKHIPTKVPKWLKILGADLGGALSGAGTGAGIGSVVPGLGTTAGAIIGGVAGGASASIAAAESTTNGGNNGSSPNATWEAEVDLVVNDNNKFDQAGSLHYELLQKVAENPRLFNASRELDLKKYHEFTQNFLRSKGFDDMDILFPFSSLEELMALNFDQDVKSLVNNGDISLSSDAKKIVNQYLNAMSRTREKDKLEFIDYSIQVENTVAISKDLEETDQAQLLVFMSTARYGLIFWE